MGARWKNFTANATNFLTDLFFLGNGCCGETVLSHGWWLILLDPVLLYPSSNLAICYDCNVRWFVAIQNITDRFIAGVLFWVTLYLYALRKDNVYAIISRLNLPINSPAAGSFHIFLHKITSEIYTRGSCVFIIIINYDWLSNYNITIILVSLGYTLREYITYIVWST